MRASQPRSIERIRLGAQRSTDYAAEAASATAEQAVRHFFLQVQPLRIAPYRGSSMPRIRLGHLCPIHGSCGHLPFAVSVTEIPEGGLARAWVETGQMTGANIKTVEGEGVNGLSIHPLKGRAGRKGGSGLVVGVGSCLRAYVLLVYGAIVFTSVRSTWRPHQLVANFSKIQRSETSSGRRCV